MMIKKVRMTPARRALFEIFLNTTKPLSVAKIITDLFDKDIRVNKTTVYRELEFLLHQGIVSEVFINSGKKFYESAETKHHHHLICKRCGIIEDVVLENDLGYEEIKIEKENGFKIQNHSLEFFGLCINCK
jgi:Fe2+ or Zn2+ uptake regulation protein